MAPCHAQTLLQTDVIFDLQLKFYCIYPDKFYSKYLTKKLTLQKQSVCLLILISGLLFFFPLSSGTWFLWHAVSRTAPVSILLFKSQQQMTCDKADVELSDMHWLKSVFILCHCQPKPESTHPAILSKNLHIKYWQLLR